MEGLVLISTILAIHIFAWLAPGPVSVLIIRNSLIYSRETGVWTALGIAIGTFIHIAYSVTGIALIISTSAIAFNIIKFLGVGYLTYLGINTLLLKIKTQKANAPTKHKDIPALKAIKTGFLVNILSPKASLFFASIFATIFASGSPLWVIVFLVIVMPLNSFVMASIFSIFFTQKKIISAYSKYQHIVNKFLGATLILLAVMIAFHKG